MKRERGEEKSDGYAAEPMRIISVCLINKEGREKRRERAADFRCLSPLVSSRREGSTCAIICCIQLFCESRKEYAFSTASRKASVCHVKRKRGRERESCL